MKILESKLSEVFTDTGPTDHLDYSLILGLIQPRPREKRPGDEVGPHTKYFLAWQPPSGHAFTHPSSFVTRRILSGD